MKQSQYEKERHQQKQQLVVCDNPGAQLSQCVVIMDFLDELSILLIIPINERLPPGWADIASSTTTRNSTWIISSHCRIV